MLNPIDLKFVEGKPEKQFSQTVVTLVIIIAVGLIGILAFGLATSLANVITLSILTALVLATLVFALRGNLVPAQILTPLALTIAVTFIALEGSGIYDAAAFAYFGIMILSGILLGIPGIIIFGSLTGIILIVVGLMEATGIHIPVLPDAIIYEDVGTVVIIAAASALALYILVRRLNEIASTARRAEIEQAESNRELLSLKNELETRVEERTRELTQSVAVSEKRSNEMRLVAEVSRAISTERDLSRLLTLVTETIAERFGFYHIGIFLLDEEKKFAVLKAANSPGGRRMLEKGHKLEIGQVGIVGTVAASRKARIALDVGDDAVFFNNPELPDTRSEMSLPLQVRNETIGVLDVQSTTSNAFTETDVQTLQILADQVAVAIDNSRLFTETQSALQETQKLYNQYLAQSWDEVSETSTTGYRHSSSGGLWLNPGTADSLLESSRRKAAQPRKAGGKDAQEPASLLRIPLRLRNQTIGTLNVRHPDEQHKWSEHEREVIASITDRIAMALENARLFQQTTSRAARERTVSEITTKIRSTTDPQEMLNTALKELQRVLGADNIQLVQKSARKNPADTTDQAPAQTQVD